jgi:hypothetical protein
MQQIRGLVWLATAERGVHGRFIHALRSLPWPLAILSRAVGYALAQIAIISRDGSLSRPSRVRLGRDMHLSRHAGIAGNHRWLECSVRKSGSADGRSR